jgi:glutathione S-transferase
VVLDSDETSFDSHAILDWLDTRPGPEHALVPPRKPARHEVLRIVAGAMGALEKVIAALHECAMHPPEKVHSP